MYLFPDLETYSDLDIKKVSLDRYASHPSTRILMCAYALDDGPIKLWQEGEDRTELDGLLNEQVNIPWNCGFERSLIGAVWKMKRLRWLRLWVGRRAVGAQVRVLQRPRQAYVERQAGNPHG